MVPCTFDDSQVYPIFLRLDRVNFAFHHYYYAIPGVPHRTSCRVGLNVHIPHYFYVLLLRTTSTTTRDTVQQPGGTACAYYDTLVHSTDIYHHTVQKKNTGTVQNGSAHGLDKGLSAFSERPMGSTLTLEGQFWFIPPQFPNHRQASTCESSTRSAASLSPIDLGGSAAQGLRCPGSPKGYPRGPFPTPRRAPAAASPAILRAEASRTSFSLAA